MNFNRQIGLSVLALLVAVALLGLLTYHINSNQVRLNNQEQVYMQQLANSLQGQSISQESMDLLTRYGNATYESHTYTHSVQRYQLLTIVFLAVLALSIPVIFLWRISRPLKHLLDVLNNVNSGDYSVRFLLPPTDKISRLGLVLNDVLERVQQSRQSLESLVGNRTVELEDAMKAAEAASVAKTQFLTNMSHEIRTPLNGITTVADLLSDTNLSDEQKDLVNILKVSGENLLELVKDIFDFSRIESGRAVLEEESFHIRNVLDPLMSQMALRAQDKKLELVFDIDPAIPDYVIGDQIKLKQIITNLILNSIKFTARGEIVFRIELRDTTVSHCLLYCTVADTGIGIEPDKLEEIFESFRQGDNSRTRQYGGTGLGTTIARELVQMMNGEIGVKSPNPNLKGTIWEESSATKGSLFWFTVELKNDSNAGSSSVFADVNPDLRQILVVDDNPRVAKVLSNNLTQYGFKVDRCTGAQEAITAVKQANHPYDVLLIDVNMPGISGFELVKTLKVMHNTDPQTVVFTASVDNRDDRKTAQQLGVEHFLLKPVEQSRLFDSLQEVLARKQNIPTKIEQAVADVITHKSSSKKEILLAEDNPVNRWVAVKVFNRLGYDPDIAENGEDVLQKLEAKTYDLIVMDVQMPVLNGLDATKQLRAKGYNTPVVAMTANAMKGDREACLQSGMDDYISKPIRYEVLKAVLHKWLDKPDNDAKTATQDTPAIDVKEAIRLLGDEETFTDVLNGFLELAKVALPKIQQCISQKDCDEVTRQAGYLKTAAANLAMPGLMKTSEALLDAAKSHDEEEFAALYEQLKTDFDKINEQAKNIREDL